MLVKYSDVVAIPRRLQHNHYRRDRKTKTKEMLPKTADDVLNGGVYLQRVRCGKPNCHCVDGELHGGYYYFVRREGTRIVKSYVPKHRMRHMTAVINEAREARRWRRRIDSLSTSTLKEMRSLIRDHEHLRKVTPSELE